MTLDWAHGMKLRGAGKGRPQLGRKTPQLSATGKATALGVVGLGAALAVAWFAVLQPRSGEVSKVDAQVASTVASNDTLRDQITARQHQQAALPELRKLSSALDSRFPPTAQQAKLFKMITAAAASAGIAPQYLTNLTVAAPVNSSPNADATAHLPGVGATIGQLATQQVSMDVKGTPANVRKFIANLEGLPRAFEVTTVNLTNPPVATAGSTTPVITTTPAVPTAPDARFETATITGSMFLMPSVTDPTQPVASGSTTP